MNMKKKMIFYKHFIVTGEIRKIQNIWEGVYSEKCEIKRQFFVSFMTSRKGRKKNPDISPDYSGKALKNGRNFKCENECANYFLIVWFGKIIAKFNSR